MHLEQGSRLSHSRFPTRQGSQARPVIIEFEISSGSTTGGGGGGGALEGGRHWSSVDLLMHLEHGKLQSHLVFDLMHGRHDFLGGPGISARDVFVWVNP
jgi:hypothetical protein